MRRSGQLTKAEERKVCDALEITRRWLDLHLEDERKPYGFWALYNAHRDFCDGFWMMCGEVA